MSLLGGALYQQRGIESMHSFVNNQNKGTLEIVPFPFVKVKDSFLLLKKKEGPTVDLIDTRTGLTVAQENKKRKRS